MGDNLEGAIVSKIDFSSERKRMSVVIDNELYFKKNTTMQINKKYSVYCKGASEIVLARCSSFIDGDNVQPLTQDVIKMYE